MIFETQKELFFYIWEQHYPHTDSFISGMRIKEPYASCFAHVLPKGSYTKYKFYSKNIVLLTPKEHTLFDQGSEEQRIAYAKETQANWQKLYDLRDELKKQYPLIT